MVSALAQKLEVALIWMIKFAKELYKRVIYMKTSIDIERYNLNEILKAFNCLLNVKVEPYLENLTYIIENTYEVKVEDLIEYTEVNRAKVDKLSMPDEYKAQIIDFVDILIEHEMEKFMTKQIFVNPPEIICVGFDEQLQNSNLKIIQAFITEYLKLHPKSKT